MNLNSAEIKDVLQSLGYQLADKGVFWQTNAIFRNGDNKTALQIYKDSGVWRDFVTQSKPMPFRALVEAHLGTNSPSEINKYLKPEQRGSFYKATEQHTTNSKIEMDEIFSDTYIHTLLPHYKFYTEKGVSKSILQKLKCGFDTKGQMYQRFVFPIYDENKRIHGLAGRDMTNKENRPKWKHMGKKTKWIYPLHALTDVEEHIDDKGVILVESIGDLLSLMEHGYQNVLVTFGLDISPALICALVSLSPSSITLSLNNDTESSVNRGLLGSCKNYLKLLSYFDVEKLKICLPTKNDFGEMKQEDFAKWGQKSLRLTPEYQLPHLKKYIIDFHSRKLISKSLYKNIKFLD